MKSFLRFNGCFRLALAAILLSTLFLHSLRWSAGLPYCHNWDEPQIVQPAIRVIRNGDYAPTRFDYGPINTYLHAGWMALTFLSGSQAGKFPGGIWMVESDRDSAWYWSISHPFLWERARMLGSGLVLLAVLFTGLGGRTLGGPWCGLAAATAFALSPVTFNSGVIVTPDALALAGAAACLWLSAVYWRLGTPSAVWGAFVAAALAGTSKYNYAPVVLLPIMAHLLRISERRERLGTPSQVVSLAAYIGAACLFLLPAFLNPTKFLHDVSSALGFYVEPDKMAVWKMPFGYLAKVAALFHAGDYTLSVASMANNRGDTVFDLRLWGLPALAVLFSGVAYGIRRLPKVAILAGVPALGTLLAAGPYNQFYFSRYLLPALPCLSVFVGLGVVSLAGEVRSRLKWRPVSAKLAVFMVVAVPLLAGIGRIAWPAPEETRVAMSRWMLANLPEKSRLWIARELRWYVSEEEQRRFQIRMGTIGQAMHTPPTAADTDYLLLPSGIQVLRQLHERPRIAEAYNRWLSGLVPEHATRIKSATPAYFGRPVANPEVILMKPDQVARRGGLILRDVVPGVTLLPERWENGLLGDGVAAIKPGPWFDAPLDLTTSTRQIRLVANGTAPLRQPTQPTVAVEIAALDKPTTAAAVRVDFSLDRSQRGLDSYVRPLPSELAPGRYRVRVRGTDVDNLPINIEMLDFRK